MLENSRRDVVIADNNDIVVVVVVDDRLLMKWVSTDHHIPGSGLIDDRSNLAGRPFSRDRASNWVVSLTEEGKNEKEVQKGAIIRRPTGWTLLPTVAAFIHRTVWNGMTQEKIEEADICCCLVGCNEKIKCKSEYEKVWKITWSPDYEERCLNNWLNIVLCKHRKSFSK